MSEIRELSQSIQNILGPNFTPKSVDSLLEQGEQIINSKIESGELKPDELQAKLSQTLGSVADGIVGADGKVNYEKLGQIVEDKLATIKGKLDAGNINKDQLSSQALNLIQILQQQESEQKQNNGSTLDVGSFFSLKA